ncbi:hypothetical protein DID88_003685 [Monilinia fructigena]|uniref:Uncharacterized protein n=1 Tax=Monilinia fructigena TaxID=38457 RepID=A0A395ITP4_9HELO|nr:hypothetical protein DID88_003685 [Monilinia fructigena]
MYLSLLVLLLVTRTFASPTFRKRVVTSLDQAAFAEAQGRDDTATRAFSSVPITTSSGHCLCDGSTGQLWDVLTSGKHNNVAGSMLVVNTLTQACLNFDPRRAAGNTVIMFSCGGRADGLFPFNGTSGPLSLSPENSPGTCLSVTASNVLDQASCDGADSNQSFTFGASSAAASPAVSDPVASVTSTLTGAPSSKATVSPAITSPLNSPASQSPVAVTQASSAIPTGDPTSPLPVSRAGGVLDPSAAAEANAVDNTAVKAFSSVALKDASGQCLFIDPTAGDFRQNLIPMTLQACDGSQNQAWDIVTSGKHNNVAGSVLVVSSLTQGCLNFDPRRAAGDTVIMFSCGGRADGDGLVTTSQLFPFTEGQTSILLAPENGNNATCLAANAAGKLDSTTCSSDTSSQSFTIVSA